MYFTGLNWLGLDHAQAGLPVPVWIGYKSNSLKQVHNNRPGEPEKEFPLLQIRSTNGTSQIWMIQISVESREIEVFLWFFSLSYQQ